MKINRQILEEKLYEFALEGNGLVVGIPGIGKSYLLRKLKDRLLNEDVLCFIIKIDNTYDSSDNAISNELGIEGNWLETLNLIEPRNKHKAVLIFDAFDAARDESKRSGFLTQIKKAISTLKNKWNIIVSARTFDAQKSTELRKIFSKNDSDSSFHNLRKFEITELSELEIESSNADLNKFAIVDNYKLRSILKIPFFLKLSESILEDVNKSSESINKKFNSENQLLNKYWEKKIENTEISFELHKFLLWFTKRLISHRALSISKNELFSNPENDFKTAYEYLIKENIIEETSIQQHRIAFSHNILFDYAVSKYCIDQSYESLLEFIKEDISRAFFYRPSFVYYFTSVWYENNPMFWNLFNNLNENNTKEIKLFVRLTIFTIIANVFEDIGELNPILKSGDRKKEIQEVKFLLQSIRFIRVKTELKDISLLFYLSKNLDPVYLFEFGFLLDRAVLENDSDTKNQCGQISRNFLSYILDNREKENKIFFDRIGSSRGVELVSKTFNTNISESRTLIKRILNLLKQENFEIGYFLNLSEDIKYFMDIDPILVGDIYKTIFSHTENSTDKTSMGSSIVMNLVSNRRQDFDMCYYRLEINYKKFLETSPSIAINTIIELINDSVKGSEKELLLFTFIYDDKLCHFYRDYSAITYEGRSFGRKEKLIKEYTKYLKELFESGNNIEGIKYIKEIIKSAEAGIIYKFLIELGSSNVEPMFDTLFPFLKIPEFYIALEVSYEIRDFIEKSEYLLSEDNYRIIENTIFKAFKSEKDYNILAALSALKVEKLQTEKAIAFMREREKIKNRRPVESSFSVKNFTTEDYLIEKGVDTKNIIHQDLIGSIGYLEAFNNLFLNKNSSLSELKPHLKVVLELWKKFNGVNDIPEELEFTLLKAITETSIIALRQIESLESHVLNQIIEIIKYSFNYNSIYDSIENFVSAGSGYSSTPRIEATSGFAPLYIFTKNKEFLNSYIEAIQDKNPIVRFNAIKDLRLLYNYSHNEYKRLIFSRLTHEEDAFNYGVLLSSLYFRKNEVIDDAKAILEITKGKRHFFSNRSFLDSYSVYLLWFLQYPELDIAFNILVEAYDYSEFVNTVIFNLFKTIDPNQLKEDFVEDLPLIDKKLEVVNSYIDKAGKGFTSVGNQEIFSHAIKVADEIILRMHFTLDPGKYSQNPNPIKNEDNLKLLYFKFKPLIIKMLEYSSNIENNGYLLGHSAHYLLETLNSAISYDPKDILSLASKIVKYSVQSGYNFDSFSIREIVNLTEKILADHREILMDNDSFQNLLSILEIHIESGWVDALELLWKLDEVFK